ncbi:MAG: hypothetical protein A2W90_09090 [Bacteroidetes bacterium GWF2_42_66]|nr:MAG: hypothetical protein A2W92_12065 [Bacteroidetes bacterium GWA2_42_15]OFY00563.1 MAG: hypothetical protein A2W89_20405 [Bacteroidetes bacterium GWE2_42_39]OFY42297.1 MAG: hypothetical protein A2W90_09090 [Bacteroidetes bacterium GWF2_42_66]HBL76449.1 hypothetical protein [Prolixibacteraceae bacterium]HCU63158.1 hypothetical protein [Prolixibacteraceae bacterium]
MFLKFPFNEPQRFKSFATAQYRTFLLRQNQQKHQSDIRKILKLRRGIHLSDLIPERNNNSHGSER